MKTNEIQIGDWLYYKGQFNAFPFKVGSITKKKIGYHAEPNEHRMHYLRLSECKPIPLTQEILEKNGFVLESYCGNVMPGKWWTRNDFVIHENMNDSVGKNNFKYEYVHQLQHALRLCGIEKEIEL